MDSDGSTGTQAYCKHRQQWASNSTILVQNATLRIYVRQRLNQAIQKMECFAIGSTDTGMNPAILSHVICTESAEWHVVRVTDKVDHIQQATAFYDLLVYPLIF
jgi:hypothetical protein